MAADSDNPTDAVVANLHPLRVHDLEIRILDLPPGIRDLVNANEGNFRRVYLLITKEPADIFRQNNQVLRFIIDEPIQRETLKLHEGSTNRLYITPVCDTP
ncbi:hypothetical protein AQJ84_30500 [Streptomyces resistomycificus]|nr:hypothetical protein AQJ84_30500 [Streptomyces resistomycificus]